MAVPIARLNDMAGGAINEGSPNVRINGRPAARKGDAVAGHGPGLHAGPVLATGSPTVRVNGIPLSRTDVDAATCSHKITTGSPNVFTNS